MRNLHELDQYRVPHWMPQTSHSGAFKVFVGGRSFGVIASVDDMGEKGKWEHVSVTPMNQKRKTCPTWEEMCAVKDMFFFPEEECVEFHPKQSKYVNLHNYCLHIWRRSDGKTQCPDLREMPTIAARDLTLELLWSEFANVPLDPDAEKIEDDFYCFPRGTDKEDIWHWFDERYSKGVFHLLYGYGGVDLTDQLAQLMHLKSLCFECETTDCAYNNGGICKFALVNGKEPEITENDGCVSGVIDDTATLSEYCDTCSEEEIAGTEVFKKVYERSLNSGMSEDASYTEAFAASCSHLNKAHKG